MAPPNDASRYVLVTRQKYVDYEDRHREDFAAYGPPSTDFDALATIGQNLERHTEGLTAQVVLFEALSSIEVAPNTPPPSSPPEG